MWTRRHLLTLSPWYEAKLWVSLKKMLNLWFAGSKYMPGRWREHLDKGSEVIWANPFDRVDWWPRIPVMVSEEWCRWSWEMSRSETNEISDPGPMRMRTGWDELWWEMSATAVARTAPTSYWADELPWVSFDFITAGWKSCSMVWWDPLQSLHLFVERQACTACLPKQL